jgi:hypothetical protein
MREKKDPAAQAAEEQQQPGKTPDKGELQALSEQVGNAEVSARVERAGQVRDELMGFVLNRLRIDRNVQLTEYSVLRDPNRWYRNVARSYERPPDPRRWHRPARFYRRALLALARGETRLATQLIEAGIQAEITAFDGLNDRTSAKLQKGEQRPTERPRVLVEAAFYPSATPTKVPQEIDLADRIEDLDPSMFQAMIKKGRKGPRPDEIWWETAEDDAKEEDVQS